MKVQKLQRSIRKTCAFQNGTYLSTFVYFCSVNNGANTVNVLISNYKENYFTES